MARNNAPATSAPRWPEPQQGQSAQRRGPGYAQAQQPAGYPAQPTYPVDPYGAQQGYPQQTQNPPHDPHAHHTHYDYQAGHDPHATTQGYGPHDSGYADQPHAGYGYDPHQQPAAAAHPYQAQAAAYAPQFEPYQPRVEQWQQHPAPSHESPYGHAPLQHAPEMSGLNDPYRPPAPSRQTPATPQLRGSAYDSDVGYAGWSQAGQAAADPYARDAGQQGWAEQQPYAEPGYGYDDPGASAYADEAPYAPANTSFGPADSDYAPPSRHDDQTLATGYDPDEVAYEDDEPRKWGGIAKLAAALVLAVGVGGGLAYGYKTFVGGAGSGEPPVVRQAGAPAKVKPDDPGGKKFAHSDSKVLGRLGDAGASAEGMGGMSGMSGGSGMAGMDADGTRKVSTVSIGRDGSIIDTGSTSQPPPATLPKGVSPVPGMTIVDGFGGRAPQTAGKTVTAAATTAATSSPQQAAPAAAAPVVVAPPATSKPTTVQPVVISKAEPESPPEPKPNLTSPVDAVPAPSASSKTAARPKTTTKAAAPATTTTKSSGSGYVAVLASIPSTGNSRMEALKRFADLQQSYGGQLGGKTPDVQQANLGAKGNFDRLIVGPPGSRQQANKLCSDLKAAGYANCWVKTY